ncbi:MAG: DUF5808 domain-containing protein [Ignavibacteria bacterium]
MKTQFDKNDPDRRRNNTDNYKWGIFFNSKDPRFILPKRNQRMGWTLNFANPYSYLIELGIIAFDVFILN